MLLQNKIFSIIKESDIKRKALLDRLGNQVADRVLRKIIEQMIEEGYLIGTSATRGYFVIKDEHDYNAAMNELKSKGKSLFARANKLHQNFFNTQKQLQYEILFEIK